MSNVSFSQFGDHRDEYSGPDQPYTRYEAYQPSGGRSRNKRFALEESYGTVKASVIGKPDSALPGGRPAKSTAAALSVWGGGSGSPDGHKEILQVQVRPGYQGAGLAKAMLSMAADRYPNLSHSAALSAEGARWAAKNPLPGDTKATKEAQKSHLIADAATAMLGGPRRTGYG